MSARPSPAELAMDSRHIGIISFLVASAIVLGPLSASAAAPAPPPLKPKVAAKVKALEADILAKQIKGNIRLAAENQAVLRVLEKAWGKDNPHLAQKVFNVGSAVSVDMNYSLARESYARAAKLFEGLHGRKHEMTATSLQMAGIMGFLLGDPVGGDALLEEATRIRGEIYGEQSVMYATYLQVWGSLLQNAHAYDRAELIYRRSLNILTKLKGPNHSSLSGVLMSLGWLFYMKGDYTNGDKFYLRSVDILGRRATTTTTSLAAQWIVIAELNHGLGRMKTAQKFYDRARDVIDKELIHLTNKFGPKSTKVRTLLMSKAKLLMATNDKVEATKILEDMKRTQVASHETAYLDYQLGSLALASGDVNTAIKYFKHLAEYYEKSMTKAAAAGPMAMLGNAYRVAGQYKNALKVSADVEKQYLKSFGPNHPITLSQLESRASIFALQGKTKRSLAALQRVHRLLEPYTNRILAGGTEGDNRQYLARVAYQLDVLLTIHRLYAPNEPDAAELAMKLILQRKGRILDAVTDVYRGMRRRMNSADRDLLDALRAARTKLSRLVIRGPGKDTAAAYQKQMSAAEGTVRRLEDKIRKRSGAFRAATTSPTLANVVQAIPKDALLVEFVAYERVNLKGFNAMSNTATPHYAVYILDRGGKIATVDLGASAPIDKLIGEFRKALADPSRDDVRTLAQAVYAKVFKPMVGAVGQSRRLILSPDGAINLIPFAALVDDRGGYLVKRFLFSYISSGRDLVRFNVTAKPRSGPMIIANPNFDGPKAVAAAPKARVAPLPAISRGRVARALRNAKWKPLPGTGAEAEAVFKVLPKATLKTGPQATEAALKALRGPKILHVATHGFFLPNERKLQLPGSDMNALASSSPSNMTSMLNTARRTGGGQTTAENPLLRSGLALGGANQLSSGVDDGVLTALEASDLDLWGTELVVLSACETGVGEVRAGDGVHGLRRALTIAGAQSLVMSLWQVDDDATKRLMTGYYKSLGQGKGRAEGLRQMQLKMLQNEELEHPFFWAAFIPAGRWQPISLPAK